MNFEESLADFLHMAAKELLAHVENLTKSNLLDTSLEKSVPEIGVEEVLELFAFPSNWKGKRIELLNGTIGVKLRINVGGQFYRAHPPRFAVSYVEIMQAFGEFMALGSVVQITSSFMH